MPNMKANYYLENQNSHYITKYVEKNTPHANMADHSVGARDESHEIEARQASMFCFDNASTEKPCFAVDLAC